MPKERQKDSVSILTKTICHLPLNMTDTPDIVLLNTLNMLALSCKVRIPFTSMIPSSSLALFGTLLIIESQEPGPSNLLFEG